MSLDIMVKAFNETIYMVFCSGFMASLAGIPLGFLLYIYGVRTPHANSSLYNGLALMVNAVRSIPFIILLVALIPCTRFLVGTSIGTTAALVPLTIAAIPFLARLTESVLFEVPTGLIEAAEAMGASKLQLAQRILWSESKSGIVNAVTTTLVNLVGYSAMAGAIGGGGLGDLAIRFGYQRFDVGVMLITVVILIALVQAIQSLGQLCARSVSFGR